jgi:hypothetical protein
MIRMMSKSLPEKLSASKMMLWSFWRNFSLGPVYYVLVGKAPRFFPFGRKDRYTTLL